MNLKKNFPADAECRVLEDALCLVFLEFQFAALAAKSDDEKMINEAFAFAKEKALDPSRFEFQMLYGIRRDLQARIAGDGFNMRTYVPYGTAWFPYFYRRVRERKENMLFVLQNLFKG